MKVEIRLSDAYGEKEVTFVREVHTLAQLKSCAEVVESLGSAMQLEEPIWTTEATYDKEAN